MISHLNNWIYQNDRENEVRFILGRKGSKPLICFGINPSTAEPQNLDNTLKSVERISKYNGFDSWIMFNIYPQRATNPKNLHKELDTLLHKKNLEIISNLLSNYSQNTIWAAWGTLIEKKDYLYNCLNDIYQATLNNNCKWITFGEKSKKGHPHHPLYLKTTSVFESFAIDNYLLKLLEYGRN
jgi:hypothetical protein